VANGDGSDELGGESTFLAAHPVGSAGLGTFRAGTAHAALIVEDRGAKESLFQS